MSRYATSSRRGDLVAFGLLAGWIVATAPLLRVYHRVTAFQVALVRVEPDGRRVRLSTPEPVRRAWPLAYREPAVALAGLRQVIRRYGREDPGIAAAAPGTRFEWTIRWSANSLRLDREVTILHGAAGAPRGP